MTAATFICKDCSEETDDEESHVEGHGPICSECLREYKCKQCYGTGQVRVLRDSLGRVDYIHGNWRGEMTVCTNCDGEGHKL